MVVAQTICLLGVVALLEVSSNRPERRDVEAKPRPRSCRPLRIERSSTLERSRRLSGPSSKKARRESSSSSASSLRRASLGLAAMLFVARAYFPSEDADTGSGLVWVFAMLATSGLAIASTLFAGTFRVPLVVGRRGGHRPDGPGRCQRLARRRPPAGDHDGLGMGGARPALSDHPQPARPGGSRPLWPARWSPRRSRWPLTGSIRSRRIPACSATSSSATRMPR